MDELQGRTSGDNAHVAFKKGDKVRIRSGGPDMTVAAVGDSLTICEWSVDGILKQDIFNLSELVPVTISQQAQQPQPTPPPSSA